MTRLLQRELPPRPYPHRWPTGKVSPYMYLCWMILADRKSLIIDASFLELADGMFGESYFLLLLPFPFASSLPRRSSPPMPAHSDYRTARLHVARSLHTLHLLGLSVEPKASVPEISEWICSTRATMLSSADLVKGAFQ